MGLILVKVLLLLPMECAVVIIRHYVRCKTPQPPKLAPLRVTAPEAPKKAGREEDTLVSYITVTRPPLPLSPIELVPPSTLHTDRPYIYSSTWVQVAPARSGVVSPNAVIVRYANWRPRGWPCPAGVGGDPPSFPSMYTSPMRPLVQLGGDRSTIGHTIAALHCGRRVP